MRLPTPHGTLDGVSGLTAPLAIAAHDLRRSYGGRSALAGLSLAVPPGTVFGLLGPNGSGKSTLITLLAAMERPDSGEVRVFGEPPSVAHRRRVGTVFQENTADPLMTAAETLAFAGRLFTLRRRDAVARSASLLAAFGLAERARDPVATFSGGMRRRLELARALLHDPDLLLLDEPTAGVDVSERRALWDTLLGPERRDRTILLATNDLAEADAVCDRVAFIETGCVVAEGTPAELKRGLRRESLRVTFVDPAAIDIAALARLPGVGEVTPLTGAVHLAVDEASAVVPLLFGVGAVASVAMRAATLEDAYLQHIGHRPVAAAGTE